MGAGAVVRHVKPGSLTQKLLDERRQLPGLLIVEAGIYDDQGSGVHVFVGGGDDEVCPVVVDKQLPGVAVLTDERVAERGAEHAGGVAARVGPAQVGLESEVFAEGLLEGSDDVIDRAVDAGDGGFCQVAVEL